MKQALTLIEALDHTSADWSHPKCPRSRSKCEDVEESVKDAISKNFDWSKDEIDVILIYLQLLIYIKFVFAKYMVC